MLDAKAHSCLNPFLSWIQQQLYLSELAVTSFTESSSFFLPSLVVLCSFLSGPYAGVSSETPTLIYLTHHLHMTALNPLLPAQTGLLMYTPVFPIASRTNLPGFLISTQTQHVKTKPITVFIQTYHTLCFLSQWWVPSPILKTSQKTRGPIGIPITDSPLPLKH